ncbi:MAG: flagellar type III secretion system pore protein FliP [Myxococcales bacterium]|nr:flagellar type III secretion system pore protein FliP [Myxococcales bacterium]
MTRALLLLGALLLVPAAAMAADDVVPLAVDHLARASTDSEVSSAVRWVVLLTSLSLLPGIVLLMTPFTRFVIVLSLLRQAMGLQQSPPNQVLVGLSLLLSITVMQPTWTEVDQVAIQPYLAGDISTVDAWDAGIVPLRAHMLQHTRREELQTAIRIGRMAKPKTLDEVPISVVVTGYVLSELQGAFVTAVKVYIPFLVVDLVVASILLGMGMMMLPPVVISLPFKLLLFVLMDGWSLLIVGLTGAS